MTNNIEFDIGFCISLMLSRIATCVNSFCGKLSLQLPSPSPESPKVKIILRSHAPRHPTRLYGGGPGSVTRLASVILKPLPTGFIRGKLQTLIKKTDGKSLTAGEINLRRKGSVLSGFVEVRF